jgi:hypothetical protein
MTPLEASGPLLSRIAPSVENIHKMRHCVEQFRKNVLYGVLKMPTNLRPDLLSDLSPHDLHAALQALDLFLGAIRWLRAQVANAAAELLHEWNSGLAARQDMHAVEVKMFKEFCPRDYDEIDFWAQWASKRTAGKPSIQSVELLDLTRMTQVRRLRTWTHVHD